MPGTTNVIGAQTPWPRRLGEGRGWRHRYRVSFPAAVMTLENHSSFSEPYLIFLAASRGECAYLAGRL